MPIIRIHHRQRARFEQQMAEASASTMVRNIHHRLADLHSAAADARIDGSVMKSGAI